jgi:hypothetical protein
LVPAQSCFDKEKLGDRNKRCELIVTLAVRKRFADFINIAMTSRHFKEKQTASREQQTILTISKQYRLVSIKMKQHQWKD